MKHNILFQITFFISIFLLCTAGQMLPLHLGCDIITEIDGTETLVQDIHIDTIHWIVKYKKCGSKGISSDSIELEKLKTIKYGNGDDDLDVQTYIKAIRPKVPYPIKSPDMIGSIIFSILGGLSGIGAIAATALIIAASGSGIGGILGAIFAILVGGLLGIVSLVFFSIALGFGLTAFIKRKRKKSTKSKPRHKGRCFITFLVLAILCTILGFLSVGLTGLAITLFILAIGFGLIAFFKGRARKRGYNRVK